MGSQWQRPELRSRSLALSLVSQRHDYSFWSSVAGLTQHCVEGPASQGKLDTSARRAKDSPLPPAV